MDSIMEMDRLSINCDFQSEVDLEFSKLEIKSTTTNNDAMTIVGDDQSMIMEEDDEEDRINVLINNNDYLPQFSYNDEFSDEITDLVQKSVNTKSTDPLIFPGKYINIHPDTVLSDGLLANLYNERMTSNDEIVDIRQLITLMNINHSPKMYFAAQYISVGKSRYFTNFAAICLTNDGTVEIFTIVDQIKNEIPKYKDIYMVKNEYLDLYLHWRQNPFGNLLDSAKSHTFDGSINTMSFCKNKNTSCALCTCLKMLFTDIKSSKVPVQMFNNDSSISKEFGEYKMKALEMGKFDFSVNYKNAQVPIKVGTDMSPELILDILHTIPISKGKVVNWDVSCWKAKYSVIYFGIDCRKTRGGFHINNVAVIYCSSNHIFSCTNFTNVLATLSLYPDAKIIYSFGYVQKKFMEWIMGVIPRVNSAQQIRSTEYNTSSFCSGVTESCATCKALSGIITLITNPNLESYRNPVYRRNRSVYSTPNYRKPRSAPGYTPARTNRDFKKNVGTRYNPY